MIVPRSRMLFWVAAVILPCALLAVLPEARLPAGCLAAIFLLALVVDAVTARASLRGIEVQLPKVVRLSKDRQSAIELHIRNPSQNQMEVRVGLPFPREIVSEQ